MTKPMTGRPATRTAANRRGDLAAWAALAAALFLAPAFLDAFWLGEIAYVYVLAIAGSGLMLLTGYAGLLSLCHAAFIGIAAYAHANMLALGVPFVASVPLAALLTGAVGVGLGLPTLRLSGIYLAIATLAFGILAEQAFANWEVVTGGYGGFPVPAPVVLGLDIGSGTAFYYVCLAVLLAVLVGLANLLRTRSGRALVALRDSEIAAQSLGVDLARFKTVAFGLSAFLAGLAGALMAHRIGFLAPDAFDLGFSLQLLLLIVVGGLGSVHGILYGAVFIGLLPQALSIMRGWLPPIYAHQPGLEPGLFGLILVLVIMFEPMGLYGRWQKLCRWVRAPRGERQAPRQRQKSYMKSERQR